jgi:hypothetical protein
MKISLIGQIAEVDREISLRERVYPEQIRRGKMRQGEAELLIGRMRAVRASLVFLKNNEDDIRRMVADRQAAPQ